MTEASISVGSEVEITGRLLADANNDGTGAVTLISDTITNAICPEPEEEIEEETEELPETGSAVIGIVALGLLSLISYSILKRYNILS